MHLRLDSPLCIQQCIDQLKRHQRNLILKQVHNPLLNLKAHNWFYQQEMYDSAISYIEEALPNARDLADKSRREYLLAQLYERSGKQDIASDYYDKAIKHTTDPLMDIYANLNKAKMLRGTDPEEIDRSVATLLRMARKDKYDLYRDIIYYAAADIAMIKPDTSAAMSYFKKSIFYNESNISYKNKAFLNLAEISYSKKDYKNGNPNNFNQKICSYLRPYIRCRSCFNDYLNVCFKY